MTHQPEWELVANLGDVSPTQYGGCFVYRDKTGHYCEEAEVLEVPEDNSKRTVYRFALDRCTLTNGVLSDNKFHPELPAWFAQPEAERAHRPQDSTYLSNVAGSIGQTVAELEQALCSEDPVTRAHAYRAIGDYHGFDNLDSYPLRLTRAEVKARYN